MFGPALSRDDRRELLDEYFKLPEDDLDRRMDLALDYQTGFEQKALSRCPITGEPALFAIDDVDLDGMWWDWGRPLRGMNDLPLSEFAWTGSMQIGSPVAPAPFVCRPGPAAPFVIPRLLGVDGMQAVVSAVPVGPHTGYLVVYYADPLPEDLPRVNDWGASSYFARIDDELVEVEATELADDYDFALRPWVEQRKLSWIAPGDESLTVQRSVDDCPFLDLPGERDRAMVLEGKVTRLPFTSVDEDG